MFFDFALDLVKPETLAETHLPSLHQAVGLKNGEVTLTVDPTIRKPIRIKSDGSAVYSPTALRDVEDLMLTLNEAFAPFSVEFLKAKVRMDDSVWPIDLVRCVSTLQMMYLRAQQCTDLLGQSILIELSVSHPAGSGKQPEPSVIFGLMGAAAQEPMNRSSCEEYCRAVRSLWSMLVRTCLNQWIRENGVSEFRLAGEILVDPAVAMAAIGEPLPQTAASNLP
jgi:hypothetical protein